MQNFKHLAFLVCTLSLLLCLSANAYAVKFSESDLQGEWSIHMLVDGDWVGWTYGNITIDANGSYSGTGINSNGDSDSISGNLDISMDGTITERNDYTTHGVMTPDKNFISMVLTTSDEYQFVAMVKKGASFSESDLEGEWSFHGLSLGDLEGWFYGINKPNATGAYNGTATTWDGNKFSISGELEITPDGIISDNMDSSVHGVMTSDKNAYVLTFTRDDNEFYLMIHTKKSSGISESDLKGDWNVGAKAAGGWPGYFYGNSTIDSNGNVSKSWTTIEGNSGTSKYSIQINDNGVITGNKDYHGAMTPDKNMFVEVFTNQDSGIRFLQIETLDAYTGDDD